MSEKGTKPADTPAAVRQRRRRVLLKESGAISVDVLLTREQGYRLGIMIETGYGLDKSSVLAKSLDDAFERTTKPRSRTKRAK